MKLCMGILLTAVLATLGTIPALATEPLFVGPQVKLKGEGNQELGLQTGAKVVCKELVGSAGVNATTLKSLTSSVTFSGCEGFGSKVSITRGELLLDATGAAGVKGGFVVTSTVGKCSVQVFSGSENSQNLSLGTIKYTNHSNGSVEGVANVSGIAYESHGGALCGENKGTGKASYVGNAVASFEGLTLKHEELGGEPLFVGPRWLTVKLVGKGTQKFKLGNGSSMTCEKAAASASVASTTLNSLTLLVNFTGCEAFGDSATVSTLGVLFDASGAVGVVSLKTFVSVPVAKCSIMIDPASNGSLGTVKYSNEGNHIVGSAGPVSGLTYTVSGPTSSLCGTNKETAHASYEGEATTELEGGYTIKYEA